MLLFITYAACRFYIFKKVSIHHMLLFIAFLLHTSYWCTRFNTSHVTLYRPESCRKQHHSRVSIHHMLLFIRNWKRKSRTGSSVSIHHMLLFIVAEDMSVNAYLGFQYITCYSLSESRMANCTSRRSFNTSHVTLYQIVDSSCVLRL